jgi:predicted alpha/beta-fold hydrolase
MHGGHCGFLETLGATNWIDTQVVNLLSRARELACDEECAELLT